MLSIWKRSYLATSYIAFLSISLGPVRGVVGARDITFFPNKPAFELPIAPEVANRF
jgi:hypothetical protein